MIDKELKYKDYLRSKTENNLVTRLIEFHSFMRNMLDMPVLIVGWQTPYKVRLIDKDQDLKQSIPRCVLEISGVETDKSDISSIQATTEMDAYDSTGTLKPLGSHYVSVPYNVSFKITIVCGNIDQAIRLSEYLSILAIKLPSCPGDDYTKSIVEVGMQSNIDNKTSETKEYHLSNTVKLWTRLIEPIASTMNPDNVVPTTLAWNQANGGDEEYPTFDDDYQPIIDSLGHNIFHNVSVSDGTTKKFLGTRSYESQYLEGEEPIQPAQ